MVYPGVQFKAVERDALSTNRDGGEMRPDFRVKAVAIHAEVPWRIAKAQEPRGDG